MNLYESFSNIERPRQLTEQEIDEFAAKTVFPAAEFHWGNNFRDPDLIGLCGDVVQAFPAPDREEVGWQGVVVTLSAVDDVTWELDSGGDPIEESIQHDPAVAVCLRGLRTDLTSTVRNLNGSDKTVWEVLAYEFPVNGGTPVMYKYFDLRSADGEELEAPKYEKRRVRNMAVKGDYSLPQRRAMTLQDRLDVTNLLLSLNVPEGIIRRPGEMESLE